MPRSRSRCTLMDAAPLLLPISILLCIILADAAKPPLQEIHPSRKLTNEENQVFFTSSSYGTELDAASGNIPIVNPTTPSTTSPPTTFMPPTTTAPPTTFMPPTTTAPPTTFMPPTTPMGNPGSLPPPTITGPPTNPMPTTNPSPMPNTTPPATSGGGGGGVGGGGGGGGRGTGTWCIASTNASPTSLQVALDYACGYGGADCSAIQQGSSCYEPNTLKDHASYAFNEFYQKNPNPTSCVFGGAAQLTNTDPSSGNCHFPSSGGNRTLMTPPPATPSTPMVPMTPPSTTTPVNPYTPSGPTGFGSGPTDYGPTGTPSSSQMSSYSLKWFMVMACLALWIPAAQNL